MVLLKSEDVCWLYLKEFIYLEKRKIKVINDEF